MKDNKLEYTINSEHRYRKAFIDNFFSMPEKFDSTRDDHGFYFDVEVNREGKGERNIIHKTYEKYKQHSLERAEKFKQKIFEEHGDYFAGKRIKFSMEVLENE